ASRTIRAFQEVAAHLPEAPEARYQLERQRRLTTLDGPVECRTEVVMILLEPVEPAALLAAHELRGGRSRSAAKWRAWPLDSSSVRPLSASRSRAYSRMVPSMKKR